MDKEETKIFEKVIEVIRTQSETIRRLQAETHGQRIQIADAEATFSGKVFKFAEAREEESHILREARKILEKAAQERATATERLEEACTLYAKAESEGRASRVIFQQAEDITFEARRLKADADRIAAHRAEERGRVEDIAKAFDAYQFATDQHRKAQELNIFGDNANGENKAARECARTFDALRAAIRAGHDPDRKGQGG